MRNVSSDGTNPRVLHVFLCAVSSLREISSRFGRCRVLSYAVLTPADMFESGSLFGGRELRNTTTSLWRSWRIRWSEEGADLKRFRDRYQVETWVCSQTESGRQPSGKCEKGKKWEKQETRRRGDRSTYHDLIRQRDPEAIEDRRFRGSQASNVSPSPTPPLVQITTANRVRFKRGVVLRLRRVVPTDGSTWGENPSHPENARTRLSVIRFPVSALEQHPFCESAFDPRLRSSFSGFLIHTHTNIGKDQRSSNASRKK